VAEQSHFGRLDMYSMERLEHILHERSGGAYSAPVLHGMLTASVVGPESLSLDFVVQTVLNRPESEGIGFDAFPEFEWVRDQIEELDRRLTEVLIDDPESYELFVHLPALPKGDDTPDRRPGVMVLSREWATTVINGRHSLKLGEDSKSWRQYCLPLIQRNGRKNMF
jgi:hypothetical protein